jgi:hypothetical protein
MRIGSAMRECLGEEVKEAGEWTVSYRRQDGHYLLIAFYSLLTLHYSFAYSTFLALDLGGTNL